MLTTKRTTQTLNDDTFASDPGLIRPAWAKVRRLEPALFPSVFWKWKNAEQWKKIQTFLVHIEEHLCNGDSRAAVVVSTTPYIVAAYTDELDCVVLLRFPDDLSRELKLQQGTRLLTVNTYGPRDRGVASDLKPGPNDYKRWGNFSPFVAEFYSDDVERIATRKATISEDEFRLAERLGYESLKRGITPRDGSPLGCSHPIKL